ncbi:MAG TPA: amidohydrolase family protein [Steroidobacteraceae bacterium]|jgi:5-methylthioadenosine/S-adenosylhomocysteine deaminase|nr:amidohydrolase family protein [Steroidobacteraceae bacterium]
MASNEPIDLLIEPRWLLPVAPRNAALPEQAVAVHAGRIVALGAAAELRQRFSARVRVQRPRHALLPGLVNAHTCACDALLQGLPVVGPRARWLREVLEPRARRGFNADFVRDGTRLGIAAMLRAGITTFADLSPLPEQAARTAAAAQVRALIGLPLSDAPGPWAEDANGYLARAERLWDEYRDDPRIALYFAPLAAAGLSDATLTRLRRVADELEARIMLRVEELPAGPAELAESAVHDGTATVAGAALERLRQLGLLRPGFSALGALGLKAAPLELLLRHGGALIGCPQAELRLGAAPAAPALKRAERLALGTDSPAAAGSFDLLAEARIAALCAGLPAAEALRLVTQGGAAVLGLAHEIGSIEPGKAADLVCIELDPLAGQPDADVPGTIVFNSTRGDVSDVWSAGRAVVNSHQLTLFDAAELESLPAAWAQRLALEAAA